MHDMSMGRAKEEAGARIEMKARRKPKIKKGVTGYGGTQWASSQAEEHSRHTMWQ